MSYSLRLSRSPTPRPSRMEKLSMTPNYLFGYLGSRMKFLGFTAAGNSEAAFYKRDADLIAALDMGYTRVFATAFWHDAAEMPTTGQA
jgi:hypothetical protein